MNQEFTNLILEIEKQIDLTPLKAQNKVIEHFDETLNENELQLFFSSLNHLELKILNNIIIKAGYIWLVSNPNKYGMKEYKDDVAIIIFKRI